MYPQEPVEHPTTPYYSIPVGISLCSYVGHVCVCSCVCLAAYMHMCLCVCMYAFVHVCL